VLIGEPQQTQADLNFVLLGIPVRVSPFFWLAALFLGWGITERDPKLMLLWIVSVFLSILVHEFGHALAFRYFGIPCHVVLYHFGGLAVPDSTFASFGYGRSQDPRSQIIISAAGPAIQLGLAAIIMLLVRIAGHIVPLWIPFVPDQLRHQLLVGNGTSIPNEALYNLVLFLLYVNIYWAVLNLLPIYPLDGGRIAREIFLLMNVRDGIRNSLVLSIVAAVGVVIFAFWHGDTFLAIMFGMLGYSSFMTLQAHSGRGGFGGGSPW